MKPSERIIDLASKMPGGTQVDWNYVRAMMECLDEQAEANGEANGK